MVRWFRCGGRGRGLRIRWSETMSRSRKTQWWTPVLSLRASSMTYSRISKTDPYLLTYGTVAKEMGVVLVSGPFSCKKQDVGKILKIVDRADGGFFQAQ